MSKWQFLCSLPMVVAVRGGRTANMELTKEPSRQPRNIIIAYLNRLLLTALIDTSSSISVLSLSLCKRLNKVLLPPRGLLLRSAFNTITTPLATATARLLINSLCYPFEFRVLFETSHDVILGCDFLKENNAIVDCVNNELLSSDKPSYDVALDGFATSNPKLYVSNNTVIPARSTSLVNLTTLSSCFRGGILETRRDALASNVLLAPFLYRCYRRRPHHFACLKYLVGVRRAALGFCGCPPSNDISTNVVTALDSS